MKQSQEKKQQKSKDAQQQIQQKSNSRTFNLSYQTNQDSNKIEKLQQDLQKKQQQFMTPKTVFNSEQTPNKKEKGNVDKRNSQIIYNSNNDIKIDKQEFESKRQSNNGSKLEKNKTGKKKQNSLIIQDEQQHLDSINQKDQKLNYNNIRDRSLRKSNFQSEITSKKNSKGMWSPEKQSEFSQDAYSDKQEDSHPASEIFETDSSNDQVSFINEYDKNSQHSSQKIIEENQGKDIFISALKEDRTCVTEDYENSSQVAQPNEIEQKGREEMGGIIIYDSYAELTGCQKIVDYHHEQKLKQNFKINPYILFQEQEVKEVNKQLFNEKAKERDFSCDQDKFIYKNLPRFQMQRDFYHPQFKIFIPQQQNVLIFDSRFENANLRKVAKVNNVEYNLWLENDLNTKGHTQWYYFKVLYKDVALRADKKSHIIKFNILNLAKTTSLYEVGMKPCIWSKKRNDADGTGWFFGGEEITYKQNQIPRENDQNIEKMQTNENNNNAFLYNNNGAGEGVDTYFTLSFKYEFTPNQDEELYFAHAQPSTYSQIQNKLLQMKEDEKHKSFLKFNLLCLSLAKVPVSLITITENVETYLDYYEDMRLQSQLPGILKKQLRQKYVNVKKLAKQSEQMTRGRVQKLLGAAIEEELKQFFEQNEEAFLIANPQFQGFGARLIQYVKDHSQKKGIIITCRVHPGEPQSSQMLDGLLNYLLSEKGGTLRKHFVIRIIPVLNPDGVIYGNYRCSLLGCDLNRKWDKPNRLLHPEIYYSKNLVKHMQQDRKVVLYCDLHGHSRKQNAFFYGCCFKNYEQEGRIRNAQLRIIPLICCQKNPLFKLKHCRFRIEKCKEQTARVVVFKEFNIVNSFTLECSFFGKEIDRTSQSQQIQKLSKKQDRFEQMSIEEYNSLGETLIIVMNNYLPSEQHMLQFLSGKILDVFYDEFIKFVPPYILRKEEEKRKKLEDQKQFQQQLTTGGRQQNSVHQFQQQQQSFRSQVNQNLTFIGQISNVPSHIFQQQSLSLNQSVLQKKVITLNNQQRLALHQGNGQQSNNNNSISAQIQAQSIQSHNTIDNKGNAAQNQNQASQEMNEEGQNLVPSDFQNTQQPPQNGLLYDDSSEQQANQAESERPEEAIQINPIDSQEILKFENFIGGIQSKIKKRELAKAQKDGKLNSNENEIDSGDENYGSEDDSSSDEQSYKHKLSKKQKKKKKKVQNVPIGKQDKSLLKPPKKNAQGFKNPENTINSANHLKSKTLALGIQNQNQQTPNILKQVRSPNRQHILEGNFSQVLQQQRKQIGQTFANTNQQNNYQSNMTINNPQNPVNSGNYPHLISENSPVQANPGKIEPVITQQQSQNPVQAILNSAEIQQLIQNQLNQGVLNPAEILNEISKAILKTQLAASMQNNKSLDQKANSVQNNKSQIMKMGKQQKQIPVSLQHQNSLQTQENQQQNQLNQSQTISPSQQVIAVKNQKYGKQMPNQNIRNYDDQAFQNKFNNLGMKNEKINDNLLKKDLNLDSNQSKINVQQIKKDMNTKQINQVIQLEKDSNEKFKIQNNILGQNSYIQRQNDNQIQNQQIYFENLQKNKINIQQNYSEFQNQIDSAGYRSRLQKIPEIIEPSSASSAQYNYLNQFPKIFIENNQNLQKPSNFYNNNQIKAANDKKVFLPLNFEKREENSGKLSQLSKDNQNIQLKQPSISSSCSVMNGLRDANIYRSQSQTQKQSLSKQIQKMKEFQSQAVNDEIHQSRYNGNLFESVNLELQSDIVEHKIDTPNQYNRKIKYERSPIAQEIGLQVIKNNYKKEYQNPIIHESQKIQILRDSTQDNMEHIGSTNSDVRGGQESFRQLNQIDSTRNHKQILQDSKSYSLVTPDNKEENNFQFTHDSKKKDFNGLAKYRKSLGQQNNLSNNVSPSSNFIQQLKFANEKQQKIFDKNSDKKDVYQDNQSPFLKQRNSNAQMAKKNDQSAQFLKVVGKIPIIENQYENRKDSQTEMRQGFKITNIDGQQEESKFIINDDYEYRNSNYISQTTSKKPPRKLFSGSIVANSIGIKNGNQTNRIANASSANSKKSQNFEQNKILASQNFQNKIDIIESENQRGLQNSESKIAFKEQDENQNEIVTDNNQSLRKQKYSNIDMHTVNARKLNFMQQISAIKPFQQVYQLDASGNKNDRKVVQNESLSFQQNNKIKNQIPSQLNPQGPVMQQNSIGAQNLSQLHILGRSGHQIISQNQKQYQQIQPVNFSGMNAQNIGFISKNDNGQMPQLNISVNSNKNDMPKYKDNSKK